MSTDTTPLEDLASAVQGYLDYLDSSKPLGADEFVNHKGRVITAACNVVRPNTDSRARAIALLDTWLQHETTTGDRTDWQRLECALVGQRDAPQKEIT